jgi:hypothetical protein
MNPERTVCGPFLTSTNQVTEMDRGPVHLGDGVPGQEFFGQAQSGWIPNGQSERVATVQANGAVGVEKRVFAPKLARKSRKIGVKSRFQPRLRWPEPRFGVIMTYEQSLSNRVCMP